MSKVIGHVTVDGFIYAHQNPTQKTEELLHEIKKASLAGDKKLKNELKQKLYSFTPAVLVNIGEKRNYDNIVSFTGLMQLDFDGIETIERAEILRDALFERHPQIVCSYLSPSGRGVKCLLRITICRDIEQYRAIHKAVITTFEEYGYFDEATKNAILPLFLSSDKDIKFRKFEETEIWVEEDWSKVEYVRLLDKPPEKTYLENTDDYAQKTIRIITDRISKISGNGHPQVRSTGLVLGSRVGAGYLSQNEAESLIENLIRENSYLQKGINGYIRTALWAINQGISSPKYYR
jgi:hypothetical protein